jgi:uncharacterized protein (DUF488 family)
MTGQSILTIGHSRHSINAFIELLNMRGVTAIADVRSSPWSRHNPQFNRADLKVSLRSAHIDYRFYGKQLGGRPSDPSLFHGSIADYEAMARTQEFKDGLEMVLAGASKHRIALMCSEHDPLDCHRCLLVGRALAERGASMGHILADGQIISQVHVEDKLLAMSGRTSKDFFVPLAEQLNAAYRERSHKVAYAERVYEAHDTDEMMDVKYG